jgi:lytic murein transglycosylase
MAGRMIGAIGALMVTGGVAQAQECGQSGAGFEAWLTKYRTTAASQGVSPRGLAALSGISYDAGVISLDRRMRSFKLPFEQFYARRVSPSLISRAKGQLVSNKALFDRIEQRFGVPGNVLVSIWGLETNFGGDGSGSKSIIQSVATLAYDCRRPEFFRNELIHALRIVDRGDMTIGEMRGGWAGEIGPMQFLPSSYYKYAVDFDGNGRKDLKGSTADMLASTANYLKQKGWQAGGGYQPGSANYGALQEWNKAEVYSRTIAVMAEKVAGR